MISVSKEKRIRWEEGHVTCMERTEVHRQFWWEKPEVDSVNDTKVHHRIILKGTLNRIRRCSTGLNWLRIGYPVTVPREHCNKPSGSTK
jgi:hypothetical protein